MADTAAGNIQAELDRCSAEHRRPLERLVAELDFAEGFCRLHTDHEADWRKRIARAAAAVRKVLANGDPSAISAAVATAEKTLAPIGKVAKTYTLHCVAHAHIDMNWMWSWPETVSVTIDTFTTMLKLMEEFEGFCFTQSQASVYSIVEEYAPAMLEQIRRRVSEGRWEVAASHWVEGDKNLASGESLARHLLYTRRYLRDLLGLSPEDVSVDWSPDTFGHAWTIPAVDSRGGVRHYYLCRGGAFEKPPVFWWKAPDGSRLLVNLETTWYNDHIGPHNAMAMLRFCEKTGIRDWMKVYGVGDHGGGPTRRDLMRVVEMDSWPIYPRFRFATARRYFEILEAQGDRWPTLDRELNYEFTGCYTSQAAIKQMNRAGENLCLEAEGAAAMATAILGREYPSETCRRAWIRTLFGHFHDILPGSGVRATREYQSALFQQTAADSAQVRTGAYRALAGAIDTRYAGDLLEAHPQHHLGMGGGPGRNSVGGALSSAAHVPTGPWPFVVFNPVGGPRQSVVTATLWDVDPADREHKLAFRVRRPDGALLPAQRIGDGNYWGHRFVDLAVPVAPGGVGWSSFVLEHGEASATDSAVKNLTEIYGKWGENIPRGHHGLENEHLLVTFDPLTGGVTGLVDKSTGRNFASPDKPLALLEYVLERPRGMSAWTIGETQRIDCPLELVSFEAGHKGPHLATMLARCKLGDSTILVTYALKAGARELEIDLDIDWLHRGGPDIGVPMLRMKFPFVVENPAGRYEIPFGAIGRAPDARQEVPALRWADVREKDGAGVAVLNDCKYGHSLDGGTLRVTLLRSSYEPDPLPEIGKHRVRLGVRPHGSAATADLIHAGAAFNHPLQAVSTNIHKGSLPADAEGFSVTPAGAALSAVKKAEDDDALIVRLFETAGKATVAKVRVDAKVLGAVAEAVEVDLLERPAETSTAKATADGFSVRLGAYGIASVRVRLDRSR
ncbi:MAG TPA: hypothetical protein DCX07_01530 [Phycisphaerales bacterium]|nr:hypothetical protein [Phycisphaerales bacterium]